MKLRFILGGVAMIWVASLSITAVQARSTYAREHSSELRLDRAVAAVGREGGQAAAPGGVFSKEQAEKGAAQYKTSCSECHGNDLAGDGFAPALTGSEFMGNWTDLTVGDLFERIRISMPPSGPNTVTPEQKADIVAHLMNMNKFPAGTGVLEPKTEVLKQIKIEQKK
jgi:S-disulfanyl-L-cysteine oxidoreductase SoxD